MTIADDYIDRVLASLPKTMPQRSQIADEPRGHIGERLAGGQPIDAVLAGLGDPVELARSYLVAEPLEAAGYGARVVAKVVDVAVTLLAAAIPAPLIWLAPHNAVRTFALLLVILLAAFGFVIYTVLAEWRTGQTFGKRLEHLQVVTESGTPISLGQAVVRQLSFLLQVFWIDALFTLFTDRRQRAFELLSKTRVVRVPVDAGRD
jgi:uncharacterized RDD family membrane protein YckC